MLLALAVVPARARAQGSPYVSLDDPDLPLFEHLVARGTIKDPSPFRRPFTEADARRVLLEIPADSTTSDGRLVQRLLRRWRAPEGGAAWWRIVARGGGEGYGSPRRDPLQPLGGGEALALYADGGLGGGVGALYIGSRVIAENRLKSDPDWTGDDEQRSKPMAFRAAEAYAAASWKNVRLHIGQVDRNWGPAGIAGLGVSNAAYPRTDIALSIDTRKVSVDFLFAPLPSERDSANHFIQRYFAGHRLAWRPTDRVEVGVWETMLLADEADPGTDAIKTLFSAMTFAAHFGRPANNNTILGLDARWRLSPALQLEAQFAGDDIRLGATNTAANETPRPDRYAVTLAARGALGRAWSWNAHYVRVSSLAYRTSDPMQSFVSEGVGLVRIVPDNDEIHMSVSAPFAGAFLLTPYVTLQRQGEGRLQDTPIFNSATPSFLIGTARRTVRGALRVAGGLGPVRILGDVGVNRVSNADHVEGRKATSFEGRVIFTIGGALQGALQ